MVLRDLNGKKYTDEKALAIISSMEDKHAMQYYDKKMRLHVRLKKLDTLYNFRRSDMDVLHAKWNNIISTMMSR